MRLTQEDGMILLGAISVELESQFYRARTREGYPSYGTESWQAVEEYLREADKKRTVELRRVRDKIKAQMKGKG